MQSFDEGEFKARVNTALERVKTILEVTRRPQYAADVSHEYVDKYLLAEFLANSAIAALFNSLEALGVTDKQLEQFKEWAKTRSVTLRLKAEENCKFLRKTEREVESDTKLVSTSVFGKSKTYTVTKVTEYFWGFDAKYELVAFQGSDSSKALVIQGRSGSVELKTSVDSTPKPASLVRPSIDVNITWLLNILGSEHKSKFSINRLSKSCHTPRRNPQVDEMLDFFVNFYSWSDRVASYFTHTLFPVQVDHGLDLSAVNATRIFVPVLPLFEKVKKSKAKKLESSKSPEAASSSEERQSVVPLGYIGSFLEEQKRSMVEKFKELQTVFSVNEKLISVAEAKLSVIVLHIKQICKSFGDGVDYIESMLYKQLVAAIGKEVTPDDFTKYLIFHNRKLFKEEYRPRPFCFAIRRPEHYPEGLLSIEATIGGSSNMPEPIHTIVSWSPAARPMRFSIDAATEVQFTGDRFLHGWVAHQFSDQSAPTLSLVARARQFSCFILLVGRIASADLFEPTYGIIIKNKDDLRLPLILETIPTPKQFKDAIASLSPEQQRFAKAFRSMQLESTLFGVCVIQIKPQLEKLLKLPNDSLTKEIRLTQDLLQLFIEYQIPSDLISYDGPENSGVASKLQTVKGYVEKMQAMIKTSQTTELEKAREEQKYRQTESAYDAPITQVYLSSISCASPAPPSKSMLYSRSSSASGSSAMAMPCPPPSAPRSAALPCPPPPAPSSAPAPQPTPQPTPANDQVTPAQPQYGTEQGEASGSASEIVDYTKIPTQLEKKFEKLDEDNCLRPTIITPGTSWTKKHFKSLLAPEQTDFLYATEQTKEKNQTFDLLDALTKSGALSIDNACLHVVIAATHCFDKTLVNTVIQNNVNPIEKVERSSLIVASTIYQTIPAELIKPDQLERIATYSPMLLSSSAKPTLEQSSSSNITADAGSTLSTTPRKKSRSKSKQNIYSDD